MYHILYKTINLITGKFYIGIHSTDELNDNYLGSGKILRRSIKKYGRENFIREILEICIDRDSLKNREREVVNEQMIQNPLCMNIRLGGEGNRKGNKISEETRLKMSKPKTEEHRENISNALKGREGKPHTEETKEKIRRSNLGTKQTQETKDKRAGSIRNFWENDPKAEDSRKQKSESLKEAWKNRTAPRKSPVRKKLSMTPAAIKLREHRANQQ